MVLKLTETIHMLLMDNTKLSLRLILVQPIFCMWKNCATVDGQLSTSLHTTQAHHVSIIRCKRSLTWSSCRRSQETVTAFWKCSTSTSLPLCHFRPFPPLTPTPAVEVSWILTLWRWQFKLTTNIQLDELPRCPFSVLHSRKWWQ